MQDFNKMKLFRNNRHLLIEDDLEVEEALKSASCEPTWR